MSNIVDYTEKTFEDIKHSDDNGNEFWEDRELQQILGYKEWRYFSTVIAFCSFKRFSSCSFF